MNNLFLDHGPSEDPQAQRDALQMAVALFTAYAGSADVEDAGALLANVLQPYLRENDTMDDVAQRLCDLAVAQVQVAAAALSAGWVNGRRNAGQTGADSPDMLELTPFIAKIVNGMLEN